MTLFDELIKKLICMDYEGIIPADLMRYKHLFTI